MEETKIKATGHAGGRNTKPDISREVLLESPKQLSAGKEGYSDDEFGEEPIDDEVIEDFYL